MSPVSADHGDEDDHGALLDQAGELEDGWRVWEFTVEEDGSDVYLYRLAGEMQYPLHVGTILYTADGQREAWSTFQGWRGEGIQVHSQATGSIVDTWEGERYGDFGLNTYLNDLDAGSYVLAVWWAAGDANWSYNLHGNDINLLDTTSGEDAFVHTTPSFNAPVNNQVWLGGPTSSHVLLGGQIDLVIDDTLLFYGFSRAFYTPYFALQTPEGQSELCPCRYFDATGEDALGPGDYTIEVTSAGVGDLIAGGADIDFPFE